MPSPKPTQWDIYNQEMSQFNFGHALWEPGPLACKFKCIQLGDVGYISSGRFRLLFSAGCPLGERRLGIHVPRTFEQLEVGEIDDREPLPAGYTCTGGVRATGALPRPSASGSHPPVSQTLGSTISFQLGGGQGAALLTKYSTYREDTFRTGAFEKYAKEHYNSWVEFAREAGLGNINPVLITGVDRTKDFAMFCYSSDDDDLRCEFTTSVPGTAPDWGTWKKTGLVHTNHGPQLRRPSSSVQTGSLTPSGDGHTEPASDEHNQSVFIRYFTIRKKFGVPRIIKAGAGPHDLGRRGRDDGESSLEAAYSSDTESDSETSLFDSDVEDDACSVTSLETESDILIHNVTADGRDDFDVVADYVFENSNAESVLLHHRDIALIRECGGSADLSTLLLERRPLITVDSDGVGMIELQPAHSAETQSGGVTTPAPSFIPDGGGQETANEPGLSESEPCTLSYRKDAEQGLIRGTQQTVPDVADRILATTARKCVHLTCDHGSHDKVVKWLSSTGQGGQQAGLPVKLSPTEAKIVGPEVELPDGWEQVVQISEISEALSMFSRQRSAVTPDGVRKVREPSFEMLGCDDFQVNLARLPQTANSGLSSSPRNMPDEPRTTKNPKSSQMITNDDENDCSPLTWQRSKDNGCPLGSPRLPVQISIPVDVCGSPGIGIVPSSTNLLSRQILRSLRFNGRFEAERCSPLRTRHRLLTVKRPVDLPEAGPQNHLPPSLLVKTELFTTSRLMPLDIASSIVIYECFSLDLPIDYDMLPGPVILMVICRLHASGHDGNPLSEAIKNTFLILQKRREDPPFLENVQGGNQEVQHVAGCDQRVRRDATSFERSDVGCIGDDGRPGTLRHLHLTVAIRQGYGAFNAVDPYAGIGIAVSATVDLPVIRVRTQNLDLIIQHRTGTVTMTVATRLSASVGFALARLDNKPRGRQAAGPTEQWDSAGRLPAITHRLRPPTAKVAGYPIVRLTLDCQVSVSKN